MFQLQIYIRQKCHFLRFLTASATSLTLAFLLAILFFFQYHFSQMIIKSWFVFFQLAINIFIKISLSKCQLETLAIKQEVQNSKIKKMNQYLLLFQSKVKIQYPSLRQQNIMNKEDRTRAKSQSRLKKLEKIGFRHEVIKLRKDYNNSNRFQELKHNQKSKSLKHIASDHQIKNSGKFLDPTKIITVSAPKWVIYDYYSSRYVRGYRAHDLNELSVFSKLLVFCTINTLITKHKIDTTRFQTIVTPSVVKFYKNSQLKVDDILTLEHLIHMLLMDEGEEHQLVIAVNIGAYLEKKRRKEYYSVYDADQKMFKAHLGEFYQLVNSYCQTMKMENVKYVEADPVKKKQINRCSASDVAALSAECLKIPYFREILRLKSKSVQIKYINNEGALQTRTIELKNKTVDNPFISYFNVCRNWEQNQFMSSNGSVFYQQPGIQPIVVVLLGSYGPNDREKDIQQIIQWYLKNSKKQQNSKLEQLKKGKKTGRQIHTQGNHQIAKIQEAAEQDSESIVGYKRKSDRFRTQQTNQLEGLLDKKLKGYDKNQFKIRERKSTKRILTQI